MNSQIDNGSSCILRQSMCSCTIPSADMVLIGILLYIFQSMNVWGHWPWNVIMPGPNYRISNGYIASLGTCLAHDMFNNTDTTIKTPTIRILTYWSRNGHIITINHLLLTRPISISCDTNIQKKILRRVANTHKLHSLIMLQQDISVKNAKRNMNVST